MWSSFIIETGDNMIKLADNQQQRELYNHWKTAFASNDAGFINYFFNVHYADFRFNYIDVENQIVSSLAEGDLQLALNNDVYKVSYLKGCFTLYNYIDRDFEKKLIAEIRQSSCHRNLFMLTQEAKIAENEETEFVRVSKRNKYRILTKNLYRQESLDLIRITDVYNYRDIYTVAMAFYQHFDTFVVYGVKDYKRYVEQCKVLGYKILVAKDIHNNVIGYVVYQDNMKQVRIHEIIYFKVKTLYVLIDAVSHHAEEIIIEVSSNEKLERFFHDVEIIDSNYVYLQVNDLDLYARIHNDKYIDNKEFFEKNIKKSNIFLMY